MPPFKEGDIVSIPLPDGRVAVGWIIYLSEYFKDCVGFVVFGVEGQMRKLPSIAWREALGPLYTSVHALEHYGCAKIGGLPVSNKRRQMTKRQVAGEVYIGDECLGTVEEVGGQDLPEFEPAGMVLLFEQIAEAFPPWD